MFLNKPPLSNSKVPSEKFEDWIPLFLKGSSDQYSYLLNVAPVNHAHYCESTIEDNC